MLKLGCRSDFYFNFSVYVCVLSYFVFLFCTYCADTHKCTFREDPHFSPRQFACLASEWTCLTLHVYMMTNPTFNLLCLSAAHANFLLFNKWPRCKKPPSVAWTATHARTPSVTVNGFVRVRSVHAFRPGWSLLPLWLWVPVCAFACLYSCLCVCYE